jgi:hypothetical protein
LNIVMREKLQHAQKILEAALSPATGRVWKAAVDDLEQLTNDPRWLV